MQKITLTPLRKTLLIKTFLALPFILFFFWGTWPQLGFALFIFTLNALFVIFSNESLLLQMSANNAASSKYTPPPPDYFNDPKYGYVVRNMKRRAGF